MNTTEVFLIAIIIIYTLPYLVCRLGNIEYYVPLVVVQIVTGVLLGPGVLGSVFPEYYAYIFNKPVIQSLNGIAWWGVMVFVWIAGIELNLAEAWRYRRESFIAASLALGMPLLLGSVAAAGLLLSGGWIGAKAMAWQFILGVGMACAVTALPILIVFMEKLEIMRQPIGQRILRYASLDDIAIWGVLAVILMDWSRVGKQALFLLVFAVAGYLFRKLMAKLSAQDRWPVGLIGLAVCGFGAEWSGLHFLVGAFLAGILMDGQWFDQKQMDLLRHHVLMMLMPVYFLSTGLRTHWEIHNVDILVAAGALLFASVVGKLLGTYAAGKILGWAPGESLLIGWLLQTKALVMIIFANILWDKHIITDGTFNALLLMAIASTMLTVPLVTPRLERMKRTIFRH